MKAQRKAPEEHKYVSEQVFSEIEESLKGALEYERGVRADLRTSKIKLPEPPRPITPTRIFQIRKNLGYSQAMFAKYINVSKRTVQAWEQGVRSPNEAALRLLAVAEKHPEALMDAI